VHEIIVIVRDAAHELRVTVGKVPDLHVPHQRKELAVETQRIWQSPYVNAAANEVSPHEAWIPQAARDRFA
jgi:hypothetical protein